MQNQTRQSDGFTLIELLVVISLLALLMAIMLPSLNRAKMITRKAICASNVRQLIVGNIAYSQENDDYFVLAAEDIIDQGGNRKRWHGERLSSGYSSDPEKNRFDATKSPMADYLADGQVTACPEFEPSVNGFEASAGGYGYNMQYIGGSYFRDGYSSSMKAPNGKKASKRSARYGEIANPASTVMFTDAAIAQGDDSIIEYSFCEPPYAANGQRLAATIHFRHEGECNVGWADGHVDCMQMVFTAAYGAYGVSKADARRLGFGWFGPDSNNLFDLD